VMEAVIIDCAGSGSSLRHWPPGTNRKRSCRLFLWQRILRSYQLIRTFHDFVSHFPRSTM